MIKFNYIFLLIPLSAGLLMFKIFNNTVVSPSLNESSVRHLEGIATNSIDWKIKSNEYWKQVLTPLQYYVTRERGTERAYTGYYDTYNEAGIYYCSCCGLQLYSSDTKFDSKTGWPSFWDALPGKVKLKPEKTFFTSQVEVACSRCEAHLGHVFDDGPQPTGKRYCMNSVSLRHAHHMPQMIT